MIRVMRYVGVHLWVAVLAASPMVFFFLPGVVRIFPGLSPVLFVSLVLPACIGISIGGCHLYAAARFRDYIKRGEAWERSGLHRKALKNYTRALRVHESFMFWPFDSGRAVLKIYKALAGLSLSSQLADVDLKTAASVYLKKQPQDRDAARLWILKIRQAGVISSLEQEVLTVLADVYGGDQELSGFLAEIFIGLKRGDVAAIRLYDTVLKNHRVSEHLQGEIRSLMSASDAAMGKDRFRPQEESTGSDRHFLSAAVETVSRAWDMIRAIFVSLFHGGVRLARKVPAGIRQLMEWRHRNRQTLAYVRAGILVAVSIGLLFFIITTLTHTFKTRVMEKRRIAIEAAIPKPFTIQVAAYLKEVHARRYQAQLVKQDLDAVVRKVDGGGKTWYVVRISAFPDKNRAAEYGRKLMEKGLIEDFFVNNR